MSFDAGADSPRVALLFVASLSGVFFLLRHNVRDVAGRRATRQAIGIAGPILVVVTALLAAVVVPDHSLRIGLLAAALGTVAVGTIDERRNLSPFAQLLAQIVIALIVTLLGWQIQYVTHPVGEGLLYLTWLPLGGTLSVGVLLLTVAWLVFIMNSFNWLDGSDGLAGSVAVVAFLTSGAISLLPDIQHDQSQALSMIGLGGSAAFLLWNWPPARVYLGTSGSWWLGLYLGLTAIASGKVATTLIILAWPTIDALAVIARRVFSLQAPWRGDTESHLHHRLRSRGASPAAIALLAAGVSAACAAAALFLQTRQQLFALAAASLIMAVASAFLWLRQNSSAS